MRENNNYEMRENNNYEMFYKMIKNWIIKDYYNPSIKLEVVWDTLLSEFICELVGEKVGKDVYLLAKEFPISNKPNNTADKNSPDALDLRSAKIDYLLCDSENTIYMVELKSSTGSFDNDQFERYCKYIGKGNKKNRTNFWKHYYEIIKKYTPDPDDNNKINNKITGSGKYIFQIENMIDAVKKIPNNTFTNPASNKKTFIEYMKANYSGKFKLVYITLHDFAMEKNGTRRLDAISKINESNTGDELFYHIPLSECENCSKMNEKKNKKWQLVYQILEELIQHGEKTERIYPASEKS